MGEAPRHRIASISPFEPRVGFSRALRVGDRVLVSGTAPIWPDGSCDPDPEVQAARCLALILDALNESGAEARHVVRTRMYVVDAADQDAAPGRTTPCSPTCVRRPRWSSSPVCSIPAGRSRSKPRP